MLPVKKINAFLILGRFLKQFGSVSFLEDYGLSELNSKFVAEFNQSITNAGIYNPWFTSEFIRYALTSLSDTLTEDKLKSWLGKYPAQGFNPEKRLNIAIIMAGNIPLVGFHDFMCVSLSGHRAILKLSSRDNHLFPVIFRILASIDPVFDDIVLPDDQPIRNPDAVIATGNDNSSRYFGYYFGKYPHIIRKNRNSAAVLNGKESPEDFRKLSDDIFLYFGMGCRSVSKIFIPRDFNIPRMLDNFSSYSYLYHHNKYANNYDYHRAILLMNREKHYDTGFLLLKEDPSYASPVGMLHYEFWQSSTDLIQRLLSDKEKIQCMAGCDSSLPGLIPFGTTQKPGPADYADNIDTLEFLFNLYKK